MISAPKTISGRRRRASSQNRIASSRKCRRFIRFRIMSSPACRDRCRCGIRRGSRGDRQHQVFIRLDAVDRRDPQPRQIRHQPQDAHHQIAKTRAARQVRAPGCQIHPGQHNLCKTLVHQPLDLLDHHARRHRPRISATVRNDAEGAAMVAAVLHLHIGAVAAEAVDQMARRFAHRHDVIDLNPLRRADQIRHGKVRPRLCLHLLMVADHAGHFGHCGKSFRFSLRGAARHDHRRTRVFPRQPADFLLGLCARPRP